MLNNNIEYFRRTLDKVRLLIWDVCITDREDVISLSKYKFYIFFKDTYDFIFYH